MINEAHRYPRHAAQYLLSPVDSQYTPRFYYNVIIHNIRKETDKIVPAINIIHSTAAHVFYEKKYCNSFVYYSCIYYGCDVPLLMRKRERMRTVSLLSFCKLHRYHHRYKIFCPVLHCGSLFHQAVLPKQLMIAVFEAVFPRGQLMGRGMT